MALPSRDNDLHPLPCELFETLPTLHGASSSTGERVGHLQSPSRAHVSYSARLSSNAQRRLRRALHETYYVSLKLCSHSFNAPYEVVLRDPLLREGSVSRAACRYIHGTVVCKDFCVHKTALLILNIEAGYVTAVNAGTLQFLKTAVYTFGASHCLRSYRSLFSLSHRFFT